MSYRDRRRQRYAEDPEYRERIRAESRARYQAHKEEINSRRRLKSATDPARRSARLKERYGISLEQYEAMLKRQGGACAICGGQPAKKLHVDHSHATRKVRGLLCRECNLGLGFYKDDQRLTMGATAYLRKAELLDGEPP